MPTNNIPSRIDGSVTDPKDQQKIEKALKSKEIAPPTAVQSGTFVDWQQIRDQLGQPFIADRPPPLRKLKEMAKDPMLRFGMHFISTPHVRAQFHIEAKDSKGINAQVAGFLDSAWRQIHASFMMQALMSMRWGHQPMVKRFATGNPGGTYRDETEADPAKQMKPVWDEGSVEPIIWKTFVPLDPGRCQPLWDDSTGEFNGISYQPGTSDIKKALGFGGSTGTKNTIEIDVYRSLWVTHNRSDEFGSIYGYPRLAFAYRYWWSHWYTWAMIDRSIERMAIPPMIAYHPAGEWEDPDNPSETVPYWEIALDTAEKLRSNAIASVPSTLASSGLDERGTQMREWDFQFLETKNAPIEQMIAFTQYCDVMKLRSIWIPEGALIEGEGGGGSAQRNIVTQMYENFVESQANLFDELIEYVNRFVIPQILVVDYPEFVNDGGTAQIVGHGFTTEDLDLLKQLIQLIGQSNPLELGVDIREGLQRLNIPLLDPLAQQQQMQQAAQATQTAPVVPGVTAQIPVGSNVGGTLNGLPAGNTNGGSVPQPANVLGFSDNDTMVVYVQPGESLQLSESEDFLSSLPGSVHYNDKSVRALMLQLRKLWQGHMRELYPDLAKHINSTTLQLADEPRKAKITITKKKATAEANRIIKEWEVSSSRLSQLAEQSRKLLQKISIRSAKVNAKKANITIKLDDELFDEWVEGQVGRLVRSVHRTVNDEVRNFLVNEIRDGHDSKTIATNLSAHFSDITVSKADTIARSEARDAFNAGTLIAGEQAGLKYVRASDGEEFDDKCRKRNGKLFTINEAWRESSAANTHPRCQLGFELIARADFSVENVNEMPEHAPEDADAWFDDSTSTAFVVREADIEATDRWLGSLIDVLVKEGYREA